MFFCLSGLTCVCHTRCFEFLWTVWCHKLFFSLLLIKFICVYGGNAGETHTMAYLWRSQNNSPELVLYIYSVSWWSNSGCEGWHQVPLHTETSHQPSKWPFFSLELDKEELGRDGTTVGETTNVILGARTICYLSSLSSPRDRNRHLKEALDSWEQDEASEDGCLGSICLEKRPRKMPNYILI